MQGAWFVSVVEDKQMPPVSYKAPFGDSMLDGWGLGIARTIQDGDSLLAALRRFMSHTLLEVVVDMSLVKISVADLCLTPRLGAFPRNSTNLDRGHNNLGRNQLASTTPSMGPRQHLAFLPLPSANCRS